MFVKQWDICHNKESIGQFSVNFHVSSWNIILVMDEHTNGPLWNGGNFRPFFFLHKNSHVLPKGPQSVLKCNLIVITVAMPLLNSTELFACVDFPPKA